MSVTKLCYLARGQGDGTIKKYRKILRLKPTQLAVGILEIHEKVLEMEALSKRALKKLVKDTPIPVVISPDNEFYLVDHHHFLFACWHVGVKKVKVEVIEDLSQKKMTLTQFWKFMKKSNFFYPFCQFE